MDGNRRGRRQRSRSPVRTDGVFLQMELIFPNLEVGKNTASVIVHATRRRFGGGLLRDRMIRFAWNGNESKYNPVSTEEGLAAVDFEIVGAGSFVFEAWDEETGVRVSKPLTIPVKVKIPGKLVVAVAGCKGRYCLCISVLEKETGAGLPDRELAIFDSVEGLKLVSTKKPSGSYIHEVTFGNDESERLMKVIVLGASEELIWERCLSGKKFPVRTSREPRLLEVVKR